MDTTDTLNDPNAWNLLAAEPLGSYENLGSGFDKNQVKRHRLREEIRLRRYSLRTEEAYVG